MNFPELLPTMPLADWQAAKDATDREWAKVSLPPGWTEFRIPETHPMDGARAAFNGKTSLIFSCGKHDGSWWLHVSIAHPEKIPSYTELADVKRIFVGKDRQALQIFPAASEHVNIHPRALHLWCCLEPKGDGLPHFGREGTI